MGMKDYSRVFCKGAEIIAAYRGSRPVFTAESAPVVPVVPGPFAVQDWSVAAGITASAIVLTVAGLPETGGSAITALEFSVDGGASWTALAGTGIGARTLVMAQAGMTYAVLLRAVNAVGAGSAAAAKSVTSGAVVDAAVHVFILAGQSNMVGRADWDGGVGHPAGVMQIARSGKISGGADGQIVAATRPLDHWDPVAGNMGLDVQFGLDYQAANPGVTLLLLPAAKGGSAFKTGTEWGVGKTYSENLIARANALFAAHPEYRLKGILWHQGESDNGNETYQAQLDAQFTEFRTRITAMTATTPIVLGELGSFAVTQLAARAVMQAVIQDTPNRLPYSAVVSSSGLTHKGDSLHFNAAGLRAMGSRYVQALALAAANVPGVPGAFAATGWSVATGAGAAQVVLGISALPATGGSALTAIQYSVDGGATWIALGGTATGSYTLAMPAAGVSYSFVLRAVNAAGAGAAQTPKTVASGVSAGLAATFGAEQITITGLGSVAIPGAAFGAEQITITA